MEGTKLDKTYLNRNDQLYTIRQTFVDYAYFLLTFKNTIYIIFMEIESASLRAWNYFSYNLHFVYSYHIPMHIGISTMKFC